LELVSPDIVLIRRRSAVVDVAIVVRLGLLFAVDGR
jgi:hypothetical protein